MLGTIFLAIQSFAERIIENYREMMMGLSMSILKDYQLAEDNVQEAMIILDRKEKLLKDPDSSGCKNYVYTVTRNLAIKAAQKRDKEAIPIMDENILNTHEGEPDIVAFADRYGFGLEVQEALSTLSREDRDLICYRYGGGHSYREIGKMMDESESTLRKRMERIRKKLRTALEERQ